jgi:hypothetical protein
VLISELAYIKGSSGIAPPVAESRAGRIPDDEEYDDEDPGPDEL